MFYLKLSLSCLLGFLCEGRCVSSNGRGATHQNTRRHPAAPSTTLQVRAKSQLPFLVHTLNAEGLQNLKYMSCLRLGSVCGNNKLIFGHSHDNNTQGHSRQLHMQITLTFEFIHLLVLGLWSFLCGIFPDWQPLVASPTCIARTWLLCGRPTC